MLKMRKNIYLSLLVASSLALSVIESMIPLPILIPGAKLGLANIVILTSIFIFGYKEAMKITILKSVLLMLVSGNVIGMMYSLTAGVASCLIMSLVHNMFYKKKKIFSMIGISIFGSITHNIVQVSVAVLVLKNSKIYSYLPFLLIISLFTGYFVGLSSKFITDKLKKNLNEIS